MIARARNYVTYYRVSTARQGRSGLGLDAQKTAVRAYLDGRGGNELASFTEVESGKVNDRPQLAAALKRCRQTRATLLVAKMDRLSRSASFLLSLRDSGVRFVAADLPEMNETVVGIMGGDGTSRARSNQRPDNGGARCRKGSRRKARQPALKRRRTANGTTGPRCIPGKQSRCKGPRGASTRCG